MKTTKQVFLFLTLIVSLTVNSQLKVRTNGALWQGYNGYPCIFMGSNLINGNDNGRWAFEVWGDDFNFYRPWPNSGNVNGLADYYLFLKPSGAIGVGKVPTHQSEVCIDVNGKVYSYGIELTSDERLKTEIKPLTDKLDKLYQLNGKSYKKHAVEDEVTLSDIKDDKGNVKKNTRNRRIKNHLITLNSVF